MRDLVASCIDRYAEEGEAALDEVRDPERIGQHYRYSLGPLLLIALERYVGEKTVRKTLGSLINDPPVKEVGYRDFRERLLSAGATEGRLTAFRDECLRAPVASGCLSTLAQAWSWRCTRAP